MTETTRQRFRATPIVMWQRAACALALLVTALAGPAAATPGQLDPSFGANGIAYLSFPGFSTTSVQLAAVAGGKTQLLARCESATGNQFCLARYVANGVLDASFGNGGKLLVPPMLGFDNATTLVTYPDGRLLAGGVCSQSLAPTTYLPALCVVRLLANGSVDTTFGVDGVSVSGTTQRFDVSLLRIMADDSIVAVGGCNDIFSSKFCAAKLRANGMPDLDFGSDGFAVLAPSQQFGSIAGATHLVLFTDGRMLLVGVCSLLPVALRNVCAARINSGGSLDQSFGAGGWARVWSGGSVAAVAGPTSQTSAAFIVGTCANDPTEPGLCTARLTSAGVLDPAYGTSGVSRQAVGQVRGTSDAMRQQDGKWVAMSRCLRGDDSVSCVARLGLNGSLDPSFGDSGLVVPWNETTGRAGGAVTLDPQGRIVVAGPCDVSGGAQITCLARLEGGPNPGAGCALNADANLVTAPASDAVLLLRYVMGFRGDALTAGAIGTYPSRTGQALENYLATLDLDADGDGQELATTDGLLILRAMLGLTGDALTAGATNASHPNVRNAQQILSWIETTHGVACLP